MHKKISFLSLSILIIAAIDSIRNLPAAAVFGSSLIFFFLLSALIFLIPTALVSAELSAAFPEKGGVYHWVYKAFGKKAAMAAIWLQWINTMVWYPSFLAFVTGVAAYVIDPKLLNNKTFLISSILTIFWSMTFLNLRGINVSMKINNFCAILGTIAPMFLLIGAGFIWVLKGNPSAISFSLNQMIPDVFDSANWVSLVAIMASFLGIELAGVHVNDVKDPQKNFPRAVFLAVAFILFSMIFGSLAIAIVLPSNQISLVSGVMQVFHNMCNAFGCLGLEPFIGLCICVGAIGTTINWLISPAKGLLHAAEFGFLPSFFTKTNKEGVASRIMIAQGVVVSLVCLLYLLVPTVNDFYWFLVALSTELYMLMYILMFFAALKLHHKFVNRPVSFKIPFQHVGMWSTCLIGLFGCACTIIISFFPPENIVLGNYAWMIFLGNIISLLPLAYFYLHEKRKLF